MRAIKFFIRAGIAFLWVVIFMSLLYSSQLYEFFRSQKSITIAAWGDVFDPVLLAEFQKKTGIKINLSYYSSNEELLVKLKKTGGKGFDLIVPSDYAVQLLQDQQLLKKINRSKLNFFPDLNPILLGHDFDPHNEYSIPWLWEIFGVGVDAKMFADTQKRDPWKLIFSNPLNTYSITMVNDPLEMIMLASLYLFDNAHKLDSQQLVAVQELLRKQKTYVKAYVDFRADYFLATRNCAAVVSSSSYILRAQRKFPHIAFLVPEKTFVTIENCALSVATKEEEKVYELLNFLYQPKNVLSHCEQFALFPGTLSALRLLADNSQQKKLASMSMQRFSQLLFFKKQIDQIDLIKIWALVKS
ncbi:MAG: extracellular solute-binding protein [Candidatus Babeliaceae bacterium]|nr:extracellular solute-binding protein [Candidatus Babeliaceae bacterium]